MSCARVLALCALCIAVAMPAATMAAAARFASPALQVSMTGGGDCNDIDPDVYPGHVEVVGNGHDDDCDGLADEDMNNNPSSDTFDTDSDGISLNAGDCDDQAATIHPGAIEIVGNFVDDDCDGLADEDAANHPSSDIADPDGDRFTIAPDSIFASGFENVVAREE